MSYTVYEEGMDLRGSLGATYYADLPAYDATAGTWADPVWHLLENTDGVALNSSGKTVDDTTRATKGLTTEARTLLEMKPSFTMFHREGDAAYAYFRDHYYSGRPFLLKDLDRRDDGAETGAPAGGVIVPVTVTKFDPTRVVSDVQKAAVELTPAYHPHFRPQRVTDGVAADFE